MEQRTEEWYLARKGMFTSSEIVKICSTGKTFDTEVFSKAYESILPNDVYLQECMSQRSTPAMQWGTDWENTARLKYEEITGREVTQVGFIKYTDHSGGSPDGLILRDKGQIEIKCPYSGVNHAKFFHMKKAEELLDLTPDSKKYYYQMQANILFNNSDYCDFVSYDPRLAPRMQIRIIRCYPNDKILKEIEEAIPKATNQKKDIIATMLDNASNKIIKQKELVI